MAFNPPTKGVAFETFIALRSISDSNYFRVNPQINAGDFKVLTWNSSPGSPTPVPTNLATLPQSIFTLTGTSGVLVKLNLSASEMNGDNVVVVARQAGSPQEWADFILVIPTTA